MPRSFIDHLSTGAQRRIRTFCDRCLVWADQDGVATRHQLLSVGWTDGMIQANLAARRWQRVYDGVYAAYTGPLPRPTQIWAAVLLCGAGAAASHETAAELWGFLGVRAREVHVSVPVSRRVYGRRLVVVHNSAFLPKAAHPTASPPRTRVEATVVGLVNAAPRFRDAVAAITGSCQPRLTTPERLRAAVELRSKLRWRRDVIGVLADVSDGAETPLELAYVSRVERAHGLPVGKRQRHRRVERRVQWIDVDYADFHVRAELDGRLGHIGEGRRQDRRRDNLSTEEGWATLRYGWVEVVEESCDVAEQVFRVLGAGGWRGRLKACGTGCGVAAAA